MKVYKFQDFLKLPEYTVYSHVDEGSLSFEGLKQKLESISDASGKLIDFYYISLINTLTIQREPWHHVYSGMISAGMEKPLGAIVNREASFDDNSLYLVYDQEDLDTLINHIRRGIPCSPHQ